MSLWAQEGFSPADFWDQTPRSFGCIMDGRAKAAERKIEEAVTLSWLIGARTGEAMGGKLKKLDHYIRPMKPRRAQTADEMLLVLQELRAGGAPVSIRQVN